MYRVLVSETVTTPKDHGAPGRAIAWCRQQDLLGGRGEKPRRCPVRSRGKALQICDRAGKAQRYRGLYWQELQLERAVAP